MKRTRAALAAFLLLLPLVAWVQPGRADEPVPRKTPRPAKADLTPQSFANFHTLIRPHDNEWRHLRVDWLTDVVAVRKKAAA
ncbi:MAG: hypothetical protein WEH44_01305, partial [Pirellulaceae bacterium]